MTRHIFTLVWNRKRSSGLIFTEILISFLVLCAVLTVALQFQRLAQEPLGYAYDDVWEVAVGGLGRSREGEGEQQVAERRQMRELLRAVRALPDVVSASLVMNGPFSNATSNNTISYRGEEVRMLAGNVEVQLRETLGLEVIAGRWLQEDDLAQNWHAVVVTRSLARTFFGLDDPIGRDVPSTDENGLPEVPEDESQIYRVVGVITDYKKLGQFDPAPHALFRQVDLDDTESYLPTNLLVRLQPGTPRGYEQTLVATLRGAAPDWTFDISGAGRPPRDGGAQQAAAADRRRRRRRVPDPDGGPGSGRRPLPERGAAHVGTRPAPGAGGERRRRAAPGPRRVAGPHHLGGGRSAPSSSCRRRCWASRRRFPRSWSWKQSSWPPR